MSEIKLYSYWRSSAAFRVRIALHLKHLRFETIPVNLISQDGGQQHSADYQHVNPQELVPTLIDGGRVIRQSLAIIEYLDESYDGARLLPSTARERARARGLAQLIACDIHPLNNLRVLQYLEHEDHMPQIERERWVQHWIKLGFKAYEEMLTSNPSTGDYSEGDIPSIADCCLVPQVFNAQRFGIDMKAYPEIMRITANCLKLPEFDAARPERQPDAPKG